MSSLAASAMLKNETDPDRRRQLTSWRKASLGWWGVGAIVAVVGIIIVVAFASSHGAGGTSGSCKGGPDKFDAMNITYMSTDNKHWTATYPCLGGGSTTLPVPRRAVPGGGR